jgi:chromate transport protein ChrA
VPWVLALTAPAAVAIVWGTFLAPKRRVDLPKPARFAIELAVFGVAAIALWATGQETLAIVLAAAALVSGILNYAWS